MWDVLFLDLHAFLALNLKSKQVKHTNSSTSPPLLLHPFSSTAATLLPTAPSHRNHPSTDVLSSLLPSTFSPASTSSPAATSSSIPPSHCPNHPPIVAVNVNSSRHQRQQQPTTSTTAINVTTRHQQNSFQTSALMEVVPLEIWHD